MPTPAILLRRLWGELPVYLYAGVCGAIVLSLWRSYGVGYDAGQTQTSFDIFMVCAIIMCFADVIWGLARHRPANPIDFLKQRYLSPDLAVRLLAGAPALALCIVLIPIFSSLKSMIPLLNAYSWDATFIVWDRAIFFGHDAWQMLQPVLGHPPVTAALAVAYHVWALLLYPGCIFFAISGAVTPAIKRRFFLSYALCWSLVGGVLATMLASVGPVFAEPLAKISTFKPQMDYLHAANQQLPVMTVAVQDMLLNRFSAGDGSLGSGISAMPSMHVAIATLFWLAMRDVSPRAGKVFLAFLVTIWIGSIHLAYHYAVDGLVSMVAVWAIWRFSALVFSLWDRLPLPFVQPALRTNTVPTE